jgi:hypothetical protein
MGETAGPPPSIELPDVELDLARMSPVESTQMMACGCDGDNCADAMNAINAAAYKAASRFAR